MSENVSSAVASSGESATKQPLIKSMRTVKKETLKLISSWVSRSCDPQIVSSNNNRDFPCRHFPIETGPNPDFLTLTLNLLTLTKPLITKT